MLRRFTIFSHSITTAPPPPVLSLASNHSTVLSLCRFAATSNASSGSQNLQALQQLPKISQIARNLPSDWRRAREKFQRNQFLDPTRPPEVPDGASPASATRISSSNDVTQQQKEQFRQSYLFQDITAPSDEAEANRQQEEDTARFIEAEATMPLPETPVARPVPDPRLRIALVGAVNAGKSALWNKLCGNFDRAMHRPRNRVPQLVRDEPGLTRDATEGAAQVGSASDGNLSVFTLVDTPGVIDGEILAETVRAIESCHAAIFVVACDRDLSREEFILSRYLSKLQRLPVITVLSKSDLARHRLDEIERAIQHNLGHGAPVPVSAYTDVGFDVLASVIHPLVDIQLRVRTYRDWQVEDRALAGDEAALEEVRLRNSHERPIRVAFIGRTNSGKSALVNCLLGQYRSRSRPGSKMTTRDTVETECVYRGRKFHLIDTAATLRHRMRFNRPFLDQLHNSTLRAIQYADLVVVCFDAREGHPSSYDMACAHKCVDEGRPFLFAANRWDEVVDPSATAEAIDFKLKRQMNEVRYAHAVVTSAMMQKPQQQQQQKATEATVTGKKSVGLNHALLMKELLVLHDNWNRHVASKDLTRFWRKLEKSINVPMKNTRIHRIVQSHARPPTFVLRLQTKDKDSRLKPLFTSLVKNALVEEFNLRGTPVRILQETKEKHPDVVQ